MDAQVNRYIFGGMQGVKGYLSVEDALIIAAILSGQSRQGLGGGMAEIGVFYGRLLFLLLTMKAEDERVFAGDLYDIDVTPEGSGQLRTVLATAQRLGLPLGENDVWAGDSCALDPELITRRAGPIRFFSVDGGHELHHVANDAALADRALADHGVICFDDFCSVEWPEVSLGVFDFLRKHRGAYAAFCVSTRKLYVCRAAHKAFYAAVVREAPALRKLLRPATRILGEDVVRCGASKPRDLVSRAFDRAGMGQLAAALY